MVLLTEAIFGREFLCLIVQIKLGTVFRHYVVKFSHRRIGRAVNAAFEGGWW